LPDGASLRVIGRPHQDGAVAFMIEDITTEITLTRKFRADFTLFQAVLDEMEGAVAAFAPDGRRVLSNAAFTALWRPVGGGADDPVNLHGALRLWRTGAMATPLWQEIEAFATHARNRRAWSDEVRMLDGTRLMVHVGALPGRGMMVTFDEIGLDAPLLGRQESRILRHEAAEVQTEYVARRTAHPREN